MFLVHFSLTQRKKWLTEALTNMSVSPVERMTLCLEVIEGSEVNTEEGTGAQVKALEELQQWAEEFDSACGGWGTGIL